MSYTIVGLRENGNLAAYDCAAKDVSLEALERIFIDHEYSQVLVIENKGDNSGSVKRYEYMRVPSVHEVPM